MNKTLNGSINLTKMKTALKMMKNKAGEQVECLVIPIKDNQLYKGEKGVYMNIRVLIHDAEDQLGNIAMLTKNVDIKAMFGEKKTYQTWTDDEKIRHKSATPIIGNLKEAVGGSSATKSTSMVSVGGNEDELPF